MIIKILNKKNNFIYDKKLKKNLKQFKYNNGKFSSYNSLTRDPYQKIKKKIKKKKH